MKDKERRSPHPTILVCMIYNIDKRLLAFRSIPMTTSRRVFVLRRSYGKMIFLVLPIDEDEEEEEEEEKEKEKRREDVLSDKQHWYVYWYVPVCILLARALSLSVSPETVKTCYASLEEMTVDQSSPRNDDREQEEEEEEEEERKRRRRTRVRQTREKLIEAWRHVSVLSSSISSEARLAERARRVLFHARQRFTSQCIIPVRNSISTSSQSAR